MLKASFNLVSLLTVTLSGNGFAATPCIDNLTVLSKTNHQFKSEELSSSRDSEAYQTNPPPAWIATNLARTFCQVITYLPPEFKPVPTTVFLESEADVKFPDGSIEHAPLSLVTTQQNPTDHSIRVGTFEFRKDQDGMNSMFAHEMGHMIVEWASRQSGATSPDDFWMTNWSPDIYEGVADFVSATALRRTFVGSKDGWFHRDLLQYQHLSFDQIRGDRLSLRMAQTGLKRVGLVPQFKVYQIWLDWMENLFSDTTIDDPYAGGVWLAGRLLQLAQCKSSTSMIHKIVRLAATGEKFDNPERFLDALDIRKDCKTKKLKGNMGE